ncbi:Ryncolin-2,Veficolin-1,Ryncolin-1,Fibrinogen C domain-containing protein 1,Fibroleukin,Fibrinogen-like protein 1,Tenascin,Ficolin-1,Fibrinogen-like protein A,Ryncolin-3 [Mytilus edulis]|uniref:Ryncolin-2,Veficolin-1,Ryncolin-1,Fibrinogen C domain-containing protein 1,Fibroleukin,Fibrinogen-like protein 1,Tenascin,Ficolin-1,Fibrinogen-like protein A,Ryncolin-3 n=1 Tax=Mytilus edulis TaxID=6550 RepID=A0A8S3TZP4_MYTED|nr:Ryncolin-2,Veficolin-1,Ryncolin-1,Fibrinogen C domain-containing protein 1,Fibroleukin,Fibrinogen-like protein 1,Tenascin,Ficolin-1,Fibrinogen-like protein A,Ryncolin-3 [Mytilus edulis]
MSFRYTYNNMMKLLLVSVTVAYLSILVFAFPSKRQMTSTSDSGVCFYGKTAESVLSILATGNYRTVTPSVRRPKDCSDLDPKLDTSGVYTIYPTIGRGFKAYCDMKTDGGRWTVIVRRIDGSQNFNKKWIEYEKGFGNLQREFWLGNKFLHTLTSTGRIEMRVDIENFKSEKRYAKYSTFKVGDAASEYRLTVKGYTGNVADAFAHGHHSGQRFTTSDNDNDQNSSLNCAKLNRDGSGWWFSSCEAVCFTCPYTNNKKGLSGNGLMQWEIWKGSEYSLKYASMMIRRF